MPTENKNLIKRALISVSDKEGIIELGKVLVQNNIEIISTGGSAQTLREAGILVLEVSKYTSFPEIMGGRVKTLHPKIHGGILSRRSNKNDNAAMIEHGIDAIDLVVVNLYPFEKTVEANSDYETCVENIDIGGPSLIRAAAKNHKSVTVVTDPDDYNDIINAIEDNGCTSLEHRTRLAAKAYARTASYDSAITSWFSKSNDKDLPYGFTSTGVRKKLLRYGENPHQRAALYIGGLSRPGVATAKQIQGKDLSYNNLGDADAAFELIAEFTDPSIAIIKHANPCGVATNTNLVKAYREALACDPVSAFGGIVASNRTIDGALAEVITNIFTEVVIAPNIDEDAKKIFSKKENLRLLITDLMPPPLNNGLQTKPIAGGYLVQEYDKGHIMANNLRVVTKREPSKTEVADLLFAFSVCKHVKSNAIIYVRDMATVGIGAGQMSRVDSARIAAWKALAAAEKLGEIKPKTIGSSVASDAFFPFPDGLLATIEAGATSVIQPGGSVRDDEVIAAADEAGIAMVFTGIRHFKH